MFGCILSVCFVTLSEACTDQSEILSAQRNCLDCDMCSVFHEIVL